MANDVDGIVVGANGSVRVAPVGTAAPADPVIAPAAAWIDLGYANEDGVSVSKSKDITGIPAWQSFFDVRKIVTGETFKLSTALLQWGADQVKLAFGGGEVTTVAAVAGPPALIEHYKYEPPDPGELDERAMMVDWADGAKHYRLIVPRGIVVDDVETNLTKSDAAELPIGFEVVASDGIKPWYLLTDDPAFA